VVDRLRNQLIAQVIGLRAVAAGTAAGIALSSSGVGHSSLRITRQPVTSASSSSASS
jgi:hypothetical protein